jgi:hypothetical protein
MAIDRFFPRIAKTRYCIRKGLPRQPFLWVFNGYR